MKSEPLTYSIEDLQKEKIAFWEGVRNYQARNFIRRMRRGDGALFYHSNVPPIGVAGLAVIESSPRPDPTALDKNSKYYDPKSSLESPRWFGVDVRFKSRFPAVVSLSLLRSLPELKELWVLKKGQRLSIQPVDKIHFEKIVQIGKSGGAGYAL